MERVGLIIDVRGFIFYFLFNRRRLIDIIPKKKVKRVKSFVIAHISFTIFWFFFMLDMSEVADGDQLESCEDYVST